MLESIANTNAEFPQVTATVSPECATSPTPPLRLQTAPTHPKDEFVYLRRAGVDLPLLDPQVPLPARATPSRRYQARAALARLPSPQAPAGEPALGVIGVNELMGENFVDWMPANLTRLHADKYSDAFFCERRLNGFNAGQLRRVDGKPWQYEVTYDTRAFDKKPGGLLPDVTSARFALEGSRLAVHSIEHTLSGATSTLTPEDSDWEFAKKVFRGAEFVFQEVQSHLGRCHLNVEQYAMAFYRNIDRNPIRELLERHFEGTLHINKLGATNIAGLTGIIARVTPLDARGVESLLKQELARLSWRWTPAQIALPDPIDDNHFDRAAKSMWSIIREYVHHFFQTHRSAIVCRWGEIEDFSNDLVAHSVLTGSLLDGFAIKTPKDLEQLCVYVIFHATFMHSWTNEKQWDDGGDPEYASLGLWDLKHADVRERDVRAFEAAQVRAGWTLSKVHYNPIMAEGPVELRHLLDGARAAIDPGLPITSIMMSINI